MSTAVAVGGAVVGGAATVGFTSVVEGVQVPPGVVVEWDLDNDGDFDEPEEDVTGYVMALESTAGRDYPSSLVGLAGPGQLRFTVLNTDDRFSYFNAGSPLTTPPFSLKMGRKIRVRTAESAPVDPVLLARDRFGRADGPLGAAETGQAWTAHAGEFFIRNKLARVEGNESAFSYETVDVGESDVYVQATVAQLTEARVAGVVGRYVDVDNHVTVYYSSFAADNFVRLRRRSAGVNTDFGPYRMASWEGMTIGLNLSGTTAQACVGGVPVLTATVPADTGTRAGLMAFHFVSQSERPPEVDDFHVWDRLAAPIDGVLWTGDVKSVSDDTVPGFKTATVECEGVLARAARSTVAAPRLAKGGARTGLVVGDIMARANLLHPPPPLAQGALETGPAGLDDGKALDMAREFEAIEQGLIHETNEGQIGYQDSVSRDGAAPQAWFSDTPGVGQYRFSAVKPVDHRGRIINQVVANVAPAAPGPVTSTIRTGSGNVDIVMPTVDDADLIIVTIANSQNGNHEWLKPLWWQEHRDLKTALGMRIYSHFGGGGFSGATVRFYQHNGTEAGLWIAQVHRIQNWFGSYEGVLIGDIALGENATGLAQSWGRDPTLFLVAQTGIVGFGAGMAYDPNITLPVGYDWTPGDLGTIIGSGTVAFDAGAASAYKIDTADAEDPTRFDALVRAFLQETVAIAVRGYNGEHSKATLADPRTVGGTGRSVTVDDVASQDDHQAILTWESPALYRDETQADLAADSIIARYSDDRPVIELTFPATLDAAHRAQAIRRRVGDLIQLTATGTTGLGVNGRFFIEHIAHDWPDPKQWWVSWQLSPA